MTERSVADFLRNALAQVGDQHRRGAEAATTDADPDTWDSSELVEWSANRAGAVVNDGSWLQYRQLQREGGGLSVEDALQTPGALVFTFSSDPLTSRERPESAGVAISLGNGQLLTVVPGGTVEVVDASTRELTHASVIPGFSDAREQDAEGREALGALLAEHDLQPLTAVASSGPEPLYDPDGDGVPLSPDEAAARVAELRAKGAEFRAEAAAAETANDRHDADVEVARAVLAERETDLREREAVTARADRAAKEASDDLALTDRDHGVVVEEVLTLRDLLGRPRPSDDLMHPDGGAPPPRAPEETDPTVRVALEEQLTAAEAKLATLDAQRQPLQTTVAERTAAAEQARHDEAAAIKALEEQQADVAELGEPQGVPKDLLDAARAVETEAQSLVDHADEVESRWNTYRAAHPEGSVTQLPDLEVRVSGAEAYALGRREAAGDMEEDAAEADAASVAARRGAEDRTELADLRDARAAELVQRADEAQPRLDDLTRRSADAHAQAEEWAATADRRTADAARLEEAGRTEAAAEMRTRATQANEASIAQMGVSGDLDNDRQVLVGQVSAWREEATTMTGEADILDDEAASLATQATTLETDADRLRAEAEQQDRTATMIEDAIDRGVATTILLNEDGEEQRIEIPGRAPVESDLDPYRQPAASIDDADDVAPEVPAGAADNGDDITFDESFDVPSEPEPAFAATTFDSGFDEPASDFSAPLDGGAAADGGGFADDGFDEA